MLTVFVASSGEALQSGVTSGVCGWIESLGHRPKLWNDKDVLRVGDYTLPRLVEIAGSVDAAVLICTPDDTIYRRGEDIAVSRDNVLLEFGIFCAVLGHQRAAVLNIGGSTLPSNLGGMTTIPGTDFNTMVKGQIKHWLDGVFSGSTPSPRVVPCFTNKYSMPQPNKFWREAISGSVSSLKIVGGNNKSWIRRDPEQSKILAKQAVRLISGGGEFGMVFSPFAENDVTSFLRKYVGPEISQLPPKKKEIFARNLRDNFSICYADYIPYKAVKTERTLLLLPRMVDSGFGDESILLLLDRNRHREEYNYYSQDIDRVVSVKRS